jgi:hypothetical protein
VTFWEIIMPLDLQHANHTNIELAAVGDELRLSVPVVDGMDGEDGVGVPPGGSAGQVLTKQSSSSYDTAWQTPPPGVLEAVAGGAGFADVSGAVSLDLNLARTFLHTMTGNITSVSFANIPSDVTTAASWTWGLKINATGGYTLAGLPTVTWLDGSDWSDLNLSANALNIVAFSRYGSTTYAWLISNDVLALDPYKVHFPTNGSHTILTEGETLDLAGATKHGDGVITYQRNGVSASGLTACEVGDRFGITCESATAPTSVRVPRLLIRGAPVFEAGYPTVETTALTQSSAKTSHGLVLPSGIVAGDLILLSYRWGANPTNVTVAPSGYTQLFTIGGTNSPLYVYYRVATGGESGTVNTQADGSSLINGVAYRISGVAVGEGTFLQLADATGTETVPSLTASWGSAKNLFIAGYAPRGADYSLLAPDGYSDFVEARQSTTATTSSHNVVAQARAAVEQASAPAGAWTAFGGTPLANIRGWVIAVRPA